MSDRPTPFTQLIKDAGGEGTFFVEWNDHAFCVIASDFMAELPTGRNGIGLTDTSAMQKLRIGGSDAGKLLDYVSVRQLSSIAAGRVAYMILATEDGYIRDDATAFKMPDGTYMVFSAGSLVDWFNKHKGDLDVTIEDISYDYSLLSVYGPRCVAFLEAVGIDGLDSLKAFNYLQTSINGVSVIVSRTGFTGGLGYELIIPWGNSETAGKHLLASPHGSEAMFIGVAAFNSYRVECGYLIPGNDFAVPGHGEGDLRTPYDMGMDWLIELERDDDFLGKAALATLKEGDPSCDTFSVEVNEQIQVESLNGTSLYSSDGEEIGTVFASGFSLQLGKYIGLCNVQHGSVSDGTEIKVGDDKWNAVIKKSPLWHTDARTQTPPPTP